MTAAIEAIFYRTSLTFLPNSALSLKKYHSKNLKEKSQSQFQFLRPQINQFLAKKVSNLHQNSPRKKSPLSPKKSNNL
jgi:hypothetical protein